jgi:hypothetical protein
MSPTYFENGRALARLPWFRSDGGRLTLREPLGCPVLDVHTHLALSYLLPGGVDLAARHPETEHYLPLGRAIELDVYANRNFSDDDLRRLRRDLTWASATRGGMRRTHTAPNLLAEMDELGITRAVLLPIDFPFLSQNAERYLDVAAREPRFLAFGSVHPFARDPADRLRAQDARGARGVKVHPAVQLVAPDHPRAVALYRVCGELGLPVLWHCGPVGIEPPLGRRLSQVKHYWGAIRACPETTFVLGHSGALQFELGLELSLRYPNVWLEVSSQSLGNVRRIVAEGPPDRVLFGSDWPFYHQSLALAKVLLATEGDPAARRRILWDNGARLLGLEPA